MPNSRVIAFDTSILSENAGDSIIMKYINSILQELFEEDYVVHISTHDTMGKVAKHYCSKANIKVMCGTNILTADIINKRTWNVNARDIPYIRGTVLLGAGWRDYEEETDLYSKFFWNNVLSTSFIHSVRDNYTLERLKKIGIKNVIYTGCPTMWGLTPEICEKIPTRKGTDVITTLTNYRDDKPDIDKKMINCLFKHYKNVYIWLQALEDYEYLMTLDLEKVPKVIGPGLYNYAKVLRKDDIDYVGTRLHSGIEALNSKKRTIIIAKDNRAIEIAKDTNLTIINDGEIEKLDDLIESNIEYDIKIPIDNIRAWREQFLNS